MPVTLNDLAKHATVTGYRHIYLERCNPRSRPYRVRIDRLHLGYYSSLSEAAKALLNYLNGFPLKQTGKSR